MKDMKTNSFWDAFIFFFNFKIIENASLVLCCFYWKGVFNKNLIQHKKDNINGVLISALHHVNTRANKELCRYYREQRKSLQGFYQRIFWVCLSSHAISALLYLLAAVRAAEQLLEFAQGFFSLPALVGFGTLFDPPGKIVRYQTKVML